MESWMRDFAGVRCVTVASEIGVVISITFDGHDARINVLKVGRACVRNDKHL
jgi:hypothetical protein